MQNELALLRIGDEPAQRDEKTISDMARIYSVSLRTLRFYEDKGLLRPRRQGTSRYYSARDCVRLELVLKGKRLGFTLSEIQELISSREKPGTTLSDSADLTVSLGQEQISAQIAHLERQRAELDSAIDELLRMSRRMTVDVG